ncbi:MAG: pyridoxal-phosphate-dependent aminotransferase family protein [Caldisericaceae bacterium]
MKELLLIPGPTPVSTEVLAALSQETISHTDERFVRIMSDTLSKTKLVFGAASGYPFVVAGSGTLGMEIALTNILKDDENLLVVSHGYFGDRFIDIAKALNVNADYLKAPTGCTVPINDIEKSIKSKHYDAVTITHVDTSTGTLADLELIAKSIREVSPSTLIVVDAVCAAGGVSEKFDDWGIDVIFTGSQKAIAVPPGLTMLAFSEKAIEKRKSVQKVRTYYGDILRWLPVMEDPHKYFATPAVNMVYALNKSLNDIVTFGLSNYIDKHYKLAKLVRRSMSSMGFELVSKNPAPTLSVFRYPQGVNDLDFRDRLYKKGVVVAGALAELQGKAFRMGHMGSVTEDELFVAVKKIAQVLGEYGLDYNYGEVFSGFTEK